MSRSEDRKSGLGFALDRTSKWTLAHKGFTMMVSVLTALGGTLVYAYTQYTALSTDTETREAIEVYDHGYKGPLSDEDWRKGGMASKTRKQVESLETLLQLARAEQVKRDHDLERVWWWQVGYSAAEKEPCSKLRMAAATHAREQFNLVLQERPGVSYEIAYTTALNQPWYERRRLVVGAGCARD